MNDLLMAEILTSDSDEIAELRANASLLGKFVDLAKTIDEMPNINKRFYEESRSLYQATSVGRSVAQLETLLAQFFGPPVKPAGTPLARKLRKNSSVKYLGGLQKEQTLFLLSLESGEFYGALWPWRRNKKKIEIHMGYCSDWITDEDYEQIDTFLKRSLSKSAFEKMDTAVGGQIRGISLPSFLQMAEMEHSSFTLRITTGNKLGRLFINNGSLIAAQTDDLKGREAAYHIISWDDVAIEIAPAEDDRSDDIKQPLMHVLMESLKLKDERTATGGMPTAPKPASRPTKTEAEASKRLVQLQRAPTPTLPGKQRSLTKILAAMLVAALLGVGALFVVEHLQRGSDQATGFEDLLAEVQKADSPQQKMVLLENYLAAHPKAAYANQVKVKIEEAKKALQEEEFEHITLEISKLEINEAYEKKAIAMYGDFLERYPDSHLTQRINQSIADIKNLIDQYYYEELKRAARLNFKERLEIYRQYLSRFPQGKYQHDVTVLIEQMGKQYFEYLKTEAAECEKNQNWNPCIQRCESFIESYAGTSLTQEAIALKAQWSDKQNLDNLRRAAQEAGNDYQKAYDAYQDYLKRNPQTTQKAAIEDAMQTLEKHLDRQRAWLAVRTYVTDPSHPIFKRIQHLDKYIQANLSGPFSADAQQLMDRLERERQVSLRQRRIEAKKQEELARIQREREKRAEQARRVRELTAKVEGMLRGSQRYRSNADGSFTDLTTGLTWTILDSYQTLGGCLSHADAQKYVRSLRQSDHTDWRLPTASELAAILKQPPFFPPSGAQWYWSSESYAKGYHTVANIVSAKAETIYTREFRKVDECGAVRAVRP